MAKKDSRLPLVLLGAGGIVVVASLLLLAGTGAIRLAGTGGLTGTTFGGGTIQAMSCPSADRCVITISTGGSQAVTATLTPEGVKQLTAGKFTAASNLEIAIGAPNQWAVYGIVAQPGNPPGTLRAAHLTGWDTDTTGFFYSPTKIADATAISGATWQPGVVSTVGPWTKGAIKPDMASPATSGCNVYRPNSFVPDRNSWNWNALVRTAQGAFATFYEYECASFVPVGVWGTLNGPQFGFEATVFLNGQPVKVGNGNFGAAPQTANIGIGTLTYDGSLGTGLSAPSDSNFAAVYFFDDAAWRVVPAGLKYDSGALVGGPVNAYLTGQSQNTIPSSVNPLITPLSFSAGIFTTISNLLGSSSDADRWAAVNRLLALGGPADIANVNLRSFTGAACGGNQPTQQSSILCSFAPTVTGSRDSGTVQVPARGVAWGTPVLTLTLDAAGVRTLGIKIFGGTPANVQVGGAATAAVGGVLKVSAQNVGGDGNFQFSGSCPGIAVSSATLPAPAGQTITANLAIASTGTIATATALQCTGTVNDVGTGATATGSGSLALSSTPSCITGDLQQISTQSINQCVNNAWVQLLTCGAGQAAVVQGGTASCVSTATVGGVLPSPGPSVGLPTAAPGQASSGGFVSRPAAFALPLGLIAAIIAGGIVTLAVLARRRREPPPRRLS